MNYRVDRQIDKLKDDIVDLFDLDDWASRLGRIANGFYCFDYF